MACHTEGELCRWVTRAGSTDGHWKSLYFVVSAERADPEFVMLHQYNSRDDAGRRARAARKKARLRLGPDAGVYTVADVEASDKFGAAAGLTFVVHPKYESTAWPQRTEAAPSAWVLRAYSEEQRHRWVNKLQHLLSTLDSKLRRYSEAGSASYELLRSRQDMSQSERHCDLPVVCAPMVLGSELAFRMLVRRYGMCLPPLPSTCCAVIQSLCVQSLDDRSAVVLYTNAQGFKNSRGSSRRNGSPT